MKRKYKIRRMVAKFMSLTLLALIYDAMFIYILIK